jgi:sterol 24-C-methyltransferase
VWALETLRIAPKGTMSVSSFLKKGADGLVAGGKKGIYTVMYFTVARKPLKASKPLPSPKKAPAAPAAAQ